MLDCQLRPGSQHCQSGTPEFIGACVKTLDTLGLGGRCLLRLDSGNDAAANFDHFGENLFIFKRNLRKECRGQWLATARRVGVKCESRDGKNSYIGYVDHLPSGKLCVNKLVLLCGMLAFNLLRGLGQEVIHRAALAPRKITVSRRRLKPVLQNII